MAIEPDDSEYGGQTVTGAGWPHVNEDDLASAAQSFESLATHLRNVVIPAAQTQMMQLSDAWEGTGAQAALDEATAIIANHEANADAADATADKLRNMEASVVKTKNTVNKTAEEVQRDCESLNNANLRGEVRATRIAERIATGLAENIADVSANTVELAGNLGVPPGTPGADGKMPTPPRDVPASPDGRETTPIADVGNAPPPPPPTTLNPPNGRDTSPIANVGNTPPAPPPTTLNRPNERDTTPIANVGNTPPPPPTPAEAPAPASAGAGVPASPAASSGGGGASSASGGGPSPSGSKSGSSSGSPSSTSVTPAASADGPTGPDSTKAATDAAGASPPFDAAARAPLSAMNPANTPLSAPAPASAPTPSPTPTPPPTAAPPPAPAASGGAPLTGGGSAAPPPPVGAAPGGGPTAPPMPLGPPATPPPAAPVPSGAPAGLPGPGVAPASTSSSVAGAAAAPVPVSTARAERDAAVAAATAGALRRKTGGNDPAQLARHIGAALNASGTNDFGFFWVTGLMVDGTIVVANSYGLGYIPEGVNLPDHVKMVSADESIPPAERARWVTYPVVAVQGWAQHHNADLRAVVATEAQFDQFDPGTARITLQPEDIPEDGAMRGRSRLEVIAPTAAARLAAVSDTGLRELLPAAPVDVNPPADESFTKWFEVTKTMFSSDTARGTAQLQAFVTYADHAQELAVYRAHTSTDFALQRTAIADWVYWQHLSVLMSDALAATSS